MKQKQCPPIPSSSYHNSQQLNAFVSSLIHKSFPSAFQPPTSLHQHHNKSGKGSPPTLFSPGQNLYPRSSAGKNKLYLLLFKLVNYFANLGVDALSSLDLTYFEVSVNSSFSRFSGFPVLVAADVSPRVRQDGRELEHGPPRRLRLASLNGQPRRRKSVKK